MQDALHPRRTNPTSPTPRSADRGGALAAPGGSADELVRTMMPLARHVVAEVVASMPPGTAPTGLFAAATASLVAAVASWVGSGPDEPRPWRLEQMAAARMRAAVASAAAEALRRPAGLRVVADPPGGFTADIVDTTDVVLSGWSGSCGVDLSDGVAGMRASIAALPRALREVIEGLYIDQLPVADLARRLGVDEASVIDRRAAALSVLGRRGAEVEGNGAHRRRSPTSGIAV